mgnify:CR=1 FL=1
MIGTSNNPFTVLVGNLTTDWRVVSLDYLKEVHDTINAESAIIKTYGDAFDNYVKGAVTSRMSDGLKEDEYGVSNTDKDFQKY